MKREERLLRRTAIYAVGNFGSKILAYIMVLIYSYFISTDEMGYYDLIITTVAMVQPIVMLQINDGVYRYLAECKCNERNNLLKTSVIFVTISILISEIVLLIFTSNYSVEFSGWIGGYLLSTILYVYFQDVVRGMGNSKLYATAGVANSFIMLILESIGLIVFRWGIKALLISKIIANLLSCIIFIVAEKSLHNIYSGKFDKDFAKKLFQYSGPLVPNTVCWWIVNASDRYIIMYFLGAGFNGIYSMANKFPTVLTTITSIFYLAWQESAIKEYDTPNRDAFFSNIFSKYYKILFSIGIIAVPATRLVIENFVADGYISAWRYTGFLYMGAIFNSLCSFLGMGYQISKETNRSIVTTIFAAVMNIGINIFLIQKVGLQAASFSTFIAYLTLFIIRYFHTKRYFVLSFKWGEFVVLTMLMLLTIGVIFVLNSILVWILTLILLSCFVIYNRNIVWALKKHINVIVHR